MNGKIKDYKYSGLVSAGFEVRHMFMCTSGCPQTGKDFQTGWERFPDRLGKERLPDRLGKVSRQTGKGRGEPGSLGQPTSTQRVVQQRLKRSELLSEYSNTQCTASQHQDG